MDSHQGKAYLRENKNQMQLILLNIIRRLHLETKVAVKLMLIVSAMMVKKMDGVKRWKKTSSGF